MSSRLGDALRRRRERLRGLPPLPRVRWRWWLPRLAAVMLLAFGLGYALAVFVLFPRPASAGAGIPVPALSGQTVPQASEQLQALGLHIAETVEIAHPSEARGIIIAQTPLPGQELRRGAGVRVAISAGRPRVIIPDVSGLDVERAAALLDRLGFGVDRIEEPAPGPGGRVLRMEPAPGLELELPARVLVVVSVPAPDTVAMPPDTSGALEF